MWIPNLISRVLNHSAVWKYDVAQVKGKNTLKCRLKVQE